MKSVYFFSRSKIFPWIIWGFASFLGLFTFILQGLPSVMIPELMQTFDLNLTQIGVLSSSFFYMYILMQIPAGFLIDIYGPRRTIFFSILVSALTLFWFAYATHYWEAIVSRMILGFALSPVVITTFCLITRWFKPFLFPLMISLSEFIGLLGGIIGEGGMAKIVVSLGWKDTVILLGSISLAFVFLCPILIHDYPDHDQSIKNATLIKKSAKEVIKKSFKVLYIYPLWINGLYAGLVFGIFPSFGSLWSIPYFMERYTISVESAALLSSTFFLGACIGTPLLGWISIYIKQRRFLMVCGTFFAWVVSLFVIYPSHINLSIMYLLMGLLGFFSSIYTLSFSIANTHVCKKTKGVTMGFTNMLIIIFAAPLLQPLIGMLIKWSSNLSIHNNIQAYTLHDYSVGLTPLSICLFIACILAFFIKEGSKPSNLHDHL